jgi:protein phosphatase
MGTTVAAARLSGNLLSVAHVGDSRVYTLRQDDLTQITHDHSWVEEQVRAGTMTPTAARQHPWRNVVTRALAGGDDPEVDVTEVSVEAGQRFLLCSDGLFTVLAHDEIARILGSRSGSLQEICDRLVAAANEGGGPDNVTALVLEVDVP